MTGLAEKNFGRNELFTRYGNARSMSRWLDLALVLSNATHGISDRVFGARAREGEVEEIRAQKLKIGVASAAILRLEEQRDEAQTSAMNKT
jgi:hypothetical protein